MLYTRMPQNISRVALRVAFSLRACFELGVVPWLVANVIRLTAQPNQTEVDLRASLRTWIPLMNSVCYCKGSNARKIAQREVGFFFPDEPRKSWGKKRKRSKMCKEFCREIPLIFFSLLFGGEVKKNKQNY